MWPFVSSYPERRPKDIDHKTFDYIIIGGGTSGCVLASRLSEDPSVSVLVLEKGRVKDNFLSRIPLLSQNYWFPGLQAVNRISEPIREVDGRRVRMWSAEALGGTSRINGTIFTRGVPGGFNEWADELGLTDWGWEQVEPSFRRIENAVSHPNAKHRGHDGPVENRQLPLILKSYPYVEKAVEAVGLPIENDCNDPRASAQGYFHLDMTVDSRGQRMSSYRAWLNAKIANERKQRLTVCTGVIASKLEVDASVGQVTGVHIRDVLNGKGRDYFVKARREVIVCSGAICTPQLLMLSGIGPRDQLEPQGIPTLRELPAVGANLTDHYSFPVMMEIPRWDTLHLVETLFGFLWHFLLWLFLGTGILAGGSTPMTIFVRSTAIDEKTMTVMHRSENGEDTMDASLPRNIPDVEIMINPVNCLTQLIPGHSFFSFYTTLIQPFSRGRIELVSTDPQTNPRILYPLLTDKRDLEPMRRATRLSMRLAEEFTARYPHPAPLTFAPGMDLSFIDAIYEDKPLDADRKPTPIIPVPGDDRIYASQVGKDSAANIKAEQERLNRANWRTVSDGEIDAYAKRVCLTSLHFASTCRMSNSAVDGVVDQRLRVHGFRNLRIADASVFPKIPSAHTMAPTVMVAERCARFLKEEWAETKGK